MKEINMIIRPIEKSDYPDIAAIYNYYVESSNAAFLETNINVEFVDSLHKAALKNSFLVAENEEKVVGFCLLKSFLPMENFKRTATITYFISPEYTRCGVGNLFLNELIQYANDNHIDNFIAEIASDNIQSITFHKKHGFQECGTLNKVGFKKNKDLSILYMQKDIKQGYG